MERQGRLRLVCIQPPTAQLNGCPAEFGQQDSKGAVDRGALQPDGSLRFVCEVRAKPDLQAGRPRFRLAPVT